MSLRQKLLSQSSLLFTGRMFGAGLIFLAQAAITRLWGPEALGEYLLIIAAANIIGVILPLGFETIGSYFAAEYRAKGEGRQLRGFMLRAYGHVAVLTAIMIVSGPFISSLFGETGQLISAHWPQLCLMTLGNALMMVSSQVLVGIKRPFASFFADTMFRPVLIVGSVAVAWMMMTQSSAFELLVWMVAIAYVVIGVAQAIYCVIHARRLPLEAEPRKADARRWWRFAVPWVIIVLSTDYFFDLDLMFLASFMGKEELAVFGVCVRMFVLVSFGVTAVYAVTLPDIFESGIKQGSGEFLRKIGDTNVAAASIALGLLVALAIGGPVVLMLFGPEFQVGAVPMLILGIGLLVRAVAGPAGLALSIHDRPYTMLPAVLAGIIALVILNFALVPRFGILGAAIAAMLAQSVWAVVMWFTALKVAKVDVSIVPRLREMFHARRHPAPAE